MHALLDRVVSSCTPSISLSVLGAHILKSGKLQRKELIAGPAYVFVKQAATFVNPLQLQNVSRAGASWGGFTNDLRTILKTYLGINLKTISPNSRAAGSYNFIEMFSIFFLPVLADKFGCFSSRFRPSFFSRWVMTASVVNSTCMRLFARARMRYYFHTASNEQRRGLLIELAQQARNSVSQDGAEHPQK